MTRTEAPGMDLTGSATLLLLSSEAPHAAVTQAGVCHIIVQSCEAEAEGEQPWATQLAGCPCGLGSALAL